jgi:hypothetical protein
MKTFALLFSIVVLASVNCIAQTSAFTYQGKLGNSGMPASGDYQFEFKLFDAGNGTNQIGATQGVVATVQNGIFTTRLDFGAAAFPPGADRWLQINVRLNGSGDPYAVLSPRQQISSVPFAVRSLNSTAADALSSACVGCVTSSQIGSGSGNYIQNTTTPQATSNFNISGNGTAGGTLSGNIVNAATQYNIGGARILTNAGIQNLFAGEGAGQANTTGASNAFFGQAAGSFNTGGNSNSFFGAVVGASNTTGQNNSFFGNQSGLQSTGGFNNSFFGTASGLQNTTGEQQYHGGLFCRCWNWQLDERYRPRMESACDSEQFPRPGQHQRCQRRKRKYKCRHRHDGAWL